MSGEGGDTLARQDVVKDTGLRLPLSAEAARDLADGLSYLPTGAPAVHAECQGIEDRIAALALDIEGHFRFDDPEAGADAYRYLLTIEQTLAQCKRACEEAIRRYVEVHGDKESAHGSPVLRVQGVGSFSTPPDRRKWDRESILAKIRGGAVTTDGEMLTEAEATLAVFGLSSPRVGGLRLVGLEPREHSTWERTPGVAFTATDAPAPRTGERQ